MSGLGAAGVEIRPAGGHRGHRFGLPAEGPGSVASFGRRAVAFAIDALASGFVAGLFIRDPESASRGLLGVAVLGALYVVFVPLFGQTPAMKLLGLRLVSTSRGPLSLPRSLLRFALLGLLLPAVVSDPDGRGLHDKAAGSVVVRA